MKKISRKRGVYALVIENPELQIIRVGSLGQLLFERGEWVYVGSAMGRGATSIHRRIGRHFAQHKNKHWHIDYFLERSPAAYAIWAETDRNRECDLAHSLIDHELFKRGPIGFGASDCNRGCKTHIFQFVGEDLREILETIMKSLGLVPKMMHRSGNK